ncbi:hypothetical protein DSECCO2_586680 [anaerobic digester metagenome]
MSAPDQFEALGVYVDVSVVDRAAVSVPDDRKDVDSLEHPVKEEAVDPPYPLQERRVLPWPLLDQPPLLPGTPAGGGDRDRDRDAAP